MENRDGGMMEGLEQCQCIVVKREICKPSCW